MLSGRLRTSPASLGPVRLPAGSCSSQPAAGKRVQRRPREAAPGYRRVITPSSAHKEVQHGGRDSRAHAAPGGGRRRAACATGSTRRRWHDKAAALDGCCRHSTVDADVVAGSGSSAGPSGCLSPKQLHAGSWTHSRAVGEHAVCPLAAGQAVALWSKGGGHASTVGSSPARSQRPAGAQLPSCRGRRAHSSAPRAAE